VNPVSIPNETEEVNGAQLYFVTGLLTGHSLSIKNSHT
jgi:hypothetical protein